MPIYKPNDYSCHIQLLFTYNPDGVYLGFIYERSTLQTFNFSKKQIKQTPSLKPKTEKKTRNNYTFTRRVY